MVFEEDGSRRTEDGRKKGRKGEREKGRPRDGGTKRPGDGKMRLTTNHQP